MELSHVRFRSVPSAQNWQGAQTHVAHKLGLCRVPTLGRGAQRRAATARPLGHKPRLHPNRAILSLHRYAASRGKRTGGTDQGATAAEVCATARASIMALRMAGGETSRQCIGTDTQRLSRAVDVVLHRGRSAQADPPDNLSVHLDGKPATPRRYTRKRGDAGQKRRVALDKVEKVLSGDAEQSGVRLVLRNLDGRHRGPIHPAKGLEIAAVIEDRHVLANAKFSGLCHCCIHHLLCELRRNAVFLHDVSHWSHSSLDMYCALVGKRHRNMDVMRPGTAKCAG